MNYLRLMLLWIAIPLVLSACSGGGTTDSGKTTQLGGAVQGKPLDLTATVTTFAGPTPGAADGIGTLARFVNPTSLASDGANVYIVDSNDHTIRKMVITTGEVTTLAGKPGVPGSADGIGSAARFYSPTGIATDGSNLYVADGNNTVRKVVLSTGVVSTLAGTAGSQGYTDGIGTAARFMWLQGIATDGINVYVADGNIIRKVALSTGAVTTLAGTRDWTGGGGSVDGVGALARFNYIKAMTCDGSNLYVVDYAAIRKVVTATGEVTTVAGDATGSTYGPVDGVGTAAGFGNVSGITTDGTNLYITDYDTVRKMAISTAEVTTLKPWADVMTASRLFSCAGIVAAGAELFVADPDNRVIRKVTPATGLIVIAAGTPATGATDGPAANASFNQPQGVTTDGTNVFVADTGNGTIRKIDVATGFVSTLAGSSGNYGKMDGIGAAARFSSPQAITTDGTSLFVADLDVIRKVEIATGTVTTLVGGGSGDGIGTAAGFDYVTAITTDGTNLYVCDQTAIRQIVIATGVVTTLAGSDTNGWMDGTGGEATFGWMGGITTDGTSLFVADTSNCLIRKVDIASGEVTKLAGSPYFSDSVDGYGAAAAFAYPQGITTDGTFLYVADSGNRMIRKIEIATTEVSTLAGKRYGFKDGVGTAAGFMSPAGITTDGRSLFLVDGIGSIRRIR